MAESMTGYGRSESSVESRRFLVEIKTVNNRFCDVQIRMPRVLFPLEPLFKETITNQLIRGKADVFITMNDSGSAGTAVIPNIDLARAYSEAISNIAVSTGRPDEADAGMIARMPDVLSVDTIECDPELLKEGLMAILLDALGAVVRMRKTEGDRLTKDVLEKTDSLAGMMREVADRSSLVPAEYRERLKTRMESLLSDAAGIYYDEGRAEAEIAIFADKCSIDEELTRLDSHLKQFKTALKSDGSIGKRLDFIVQEINREINTIGSKANDLTITNRVLEMKTELEKIREQIQNLA
jgi:uncharacterized protein (TIGR00255 family)